MTSARIARDFGPVEDLAGKLFGDVLQCECRIRWRRCFQPFEVVPLRDGGGDQDEERLPRCAMIDISVTMRPLSSAK